MLTLSFLGVLVLAIAAHFSGASANGGEGVLIRSLASRWILAVLFLVTFAVLWYSWAQWNPIPVVHDEMAYVLQAQIYARGHWALPSPPLPLFWEQPHVLTEPRLAAKYFPGHPLLLAIGALTGWLALVPLVLQSLCAVLMYTLARRTANGAVAFSTWLLWLLSQMVLYFGPTYYSEATTTFCWLAGWYALLEWRGTRRMHWLVLVALATAWDAIARPLTGVAYAIPIAVVVISDVVRLRLWRQLIPAMAAGVLVVGIIPLWSARTTGDWRVTPLTLYTRSYMPYDTPGFGLDSTPPTHSITPDLFQLNRVYSAVHVDHFPRNFPAILRLRAYDLGISVWGSNGVLVAFAIVGLVTLTAAGAFAVGTGVVLLVTYLAFATPAAWTLYYYESVPAYAFLTASGIAWAASLIGRPRGVPRAPQWSWRSARWSRAITIGTAALSLPGLVWLQQIHVSHIQGRRFLVPFQMLLRSIPDQRAIVFVRYKGTHDPHVAFVRNVADLDAERIWVVYDRGDSENARLMAFAKGRRAYLFDEGQRRIYLYDAPAR